VSSDHPKLRAILAGIVLIALLAGAAALRFHRIGAKSLWLDEAATMKYMGLPFVQAIWAVEAYDAHPPLYYSLLHLWLHGSTGGARARAFSATVSVATLLVFYGLARVFLARPASLLATLLLAVSALQVYFAQEARLYALAVFFVTLSWYFLARLVAGRRLARWPLWLGLALANTAAVYTLYYTLFSMAAQGVVLLALWRSIGRKLIVPWVAWQLLPVCLFALYVPQILTRLRGLRGLAPPAGRTVLSPEGLSETASQFTSGFLSTLVPKRTAPLVRIDLPNGETVHVRRVRQSAVNLLRALTAGLGLLALAAGLAGWRRGFRTAPTLTLIWLLGPIVFLALLPIRGHTYEPKHLLFAAPALALLPAMGLAGARGLLKAFPAAVVLLWLGANAFSLAEYFDPRVEKENWRDAIHELAEYVEPGDIVVFNPPPVSLPFAYYYTPARTGCECPLTLEVNAPLPSEPLHPGTLRLDPQRVAGQRRLWLLEAKSNVAIPNPRIAEMLKPYPVLPPFPRQYDDLVGSIRVQLYDTRLPPPKSAP